MDLSPARQTFPKEDYHNLDSPVLAPEQDERERDEFVNSSPGRNSNDDSANRNEEFDEPKNVLKRPEMISISQSEKIYEFERATSSLSPVPRENKDAMKPYPTPGSRNDDVNESLRDYMEDSVKSLREDMKALHVDLIRQFHIQQVCVAILVSGKFNC